MTEKEKNSVKAGIFKVESIIKQHFEIRYTETYSKSQWPSTKKYNRVFISPERSPAVSGKGRGAFSPAVSNSIAKKPDI